MRNLSLREAADATGKSKSTISKALKIGKISYISKDEKGYQIDPSELFRVYPPKGCATVEEGHEETRISTSGNHREIELLERMNEDQRKTIEDLRRRLDDAQAKEREASEKFTALLENPRRKKLLGIF